jgi:hypothetical protein
VLDGPAARAAKVAAAPGAPLAVLPPARRARGAAECGAAAADPIRRLTGPATGALFVGAPDRNGMIPERSLS